MARLIEIYKNEIVPSLMKQFAYSSIMQVPKITKIVVNVGMGEAIQNPKLLDSSVEELRMITGQQPVVTLARKSIANFKLREGMAIGCKVTLRKRIMYEFLDRLINTSIPRIRDFRGVSGKAFDGRGNYSLGLTEQIIFPEVKYDKVEKIHGMDIVIVTTAKSDEEAKALLAGFNMPFRK
ncbi:MAG: 50S ribosomal protein L5 [Deltaproteobacteria bacterium]|nr:50S ribosomal protein L5 [Deltaproteobacteria bacterium]